MQKKNTLCAFMRVFVESSTNKPVFEIHLVKKSVMMFFNKFVVKRLW